MNNSTATLKSHNVGSTNLKRDAGNTEGSLGKCSTRRCQRLAGFHSVELTSAKRAPYLITLSTALSIDMLLSVEYSSNKLRVCEVTNVTSWLQEMGS